MGKETILSVPTLKSTLDEAHSPVKERKGIPLQQQQYNNSVLRRVPSLLYFERTESCNTIGTDSSEDTVYSFDDYKLLSPEKTIKSKVQLRTNADASSFAQVSTLISKCEQQLEDADGLLQRFRRDLGADSRQDPDQDTKIPCTTIHFRSTLPLALSADTGKDCDAEDEDDVSYSEETIESDEDVSFYEEVEEDDEIWYEELLDEDLLDDEEDELLEEVTVDDGKSCFSLLTTITEEDFDDLLAEDLDDLLVC